MRPNFAMPVPVPSTAGDDDAGTPEKNLAARVAAGPGAWEDEEWLADLRREPLLESLMADGAIAAAASAGHAHKQERALNAEMTALSLVCGALFPALGYDSTLALVFGLPGVPVRPGTPVPTGPAYSKARARSGEAPARAVFFHDAARTDIPAGDDGFAFGLEVTATDGTTLELFNDPGLAEEFGVPSPGAKPLLRLVGLLHAATRRWKAAVAGRYLDGENALADGLEEYFGPGQLNLADRGFFSMDRWIRFSAAGAHLLWRVKNGAKCVPFKTLKILKDGSELVLLRESSGMRNPAPQERRRQDPPVPPGHRRAAGLLHRADPRPQRPHQDHTDPAADHPPGPGPLSRRRARGSVCEKVDNRNRVLAFEEDRPRCPPGPARPLSGTRPPGSPGAPARP